MRTESHHRGCWEGLWLTGGPYLSLLKAPVALNKTHIITPFPEVQPHYFSQPRPVRLGHTSQNSLAVPTPSTFPLASFKNWPKMSPLCEAVLSFCPLSQVQSPCLGYGTCLFLSLTNESARAMDTSILPSHSQRAMAWVKGDKVRNQRKCPIC